MCSKGRFWLWMKNRLQGQRSGGRETSYKGGCRGLSYVSFLSTPIKWEKDPLIFSPQAHYESRRRSGWGPVRSRQDSGKDQSSL